MGRTHYGKSWDDNKYHTVPDDYFVRGDYVMPCHDEPAKWDGDYNRHPGVYSIYDEYCRGLIWKPCWNPYWRDANGRVK